MFSIQGYARLDAMFVAFRAERLATAEKELDASAGDGQMPSEDDIEQEFLAIVSRGTEREMVACKRNQVIHEQRERAEASDLAEQIDEVTAEGYAARLSCYEDNERRPDNYYHDKANCDCPLCILDGREC
jgi:hypothetical protein